MAETLITVALIALTLRKLPGWLMTPSPLERDLTDALDDYLLEQDVRASVPRPEGEGER